MTTVESRHTDRLFTTFDTSYARGTKDTNPAVGITSPNIAEIHPLMGNLRLR